MIHYGCKTSLEARMTKVENAFASAVGFNAHGAKVLNATTVAETLALAQLQGRTVSMNDFRMKSFDGSSL